MLVEFLGGGDQLGAHFEQALRLDHLDKDFAGADIRLLEASRDQLGVGVLRQHAAAIDAEQSVEAFLDPAAAP